MSQKKAEKTSNKKIDKNTYIKIAIIAGILFVVYLLGVLFFRGHFYIRSTVNGVDASFMTAQDCYEKIVKSADVYSISFLDGQGEEIYKISPDEIGMGLSYQEDQVETILSEQSGFNWIGSIFAPKEYFTSDGNNYDQAKVASLATSLDFSQYQGNVDSEDAHIDFDGSRFFVADEVYGDKIDADSIAAAIMSAVESLETTIDVTDGSCYTKPTVLSDDKKLKTCLDVLNGYMDVHIHYDLGDGITEEIPDDVKSTWFTVGDDLKVEFNRDAIGEYVNAMGKKYNTFGKAKAFTTTEGEEITIPAGSLGWKIAYDGEIDAIIADLEGGKDVTRDFTYLYKGASHGANDYGDSYIEANLSKQHLYVYKDGEMVFETDFVSGKIAGNHGTHTGAYPIAYKAKDATLRGDDYESHVKFWMPFNMGEGLHDASWRGSFGGNIYVSNGSHGCLNLPTSAAKEIFNIVDAGWPVLVFYTGNTEQENFLIANPDIKVTGLIDALGQITLESEYDIASARIQYNALSDEQKANVTNYQTLVDAENTLLLLKQQAGLLPTEQQ
ncbi:MAG: L,D-transpeptidase/peptidoglycan binding protein [Pseudobutyrivibrio sp.]|nr:L,D-transpeptidase/peptidoglycan binding protein [Pseudobutyrivibrio sp.]